MSDNLDKNNNVRSTTPAYDFANNDIITFIVDKVISQNYLDVTLDSNVKANMITFISGSNAILNKWKQQDVVENSDSIQAIIQITSMIIDYITENKSSFQNNPTTFSATIQSTLQTIEDEYNTVSIYSLNLPVAKTSPWTMAEKESGVLNGAIALYGSNYAQKQIAIALYGRIEDWDLSQITNMDGLFKNTTFNEPIGNWDVSNVTSMRFMFDNSAFNQDISKWDTSKVTNMEYMFNDSIFNQNINTSVQTRKDKSGNDEKYIAWDVSNVNNMQSMFDSSSFNQDISKWEVNSAFWLSRMFRRAINFNQTIGEKVIQLTDSDGNDFGDPYTAWNTTNSDMSYMFYEATEFNNGGSTVEYTKADTGDVTYIPAGPELILRAGSNLSWMFQGATKFNCPVTNLGPGNSLVFTATTYRYIQMFKNCNKFEQEVRGWNILDEMHLDGMFEGICTNTKPFGIKYIPHGAAETPSLLFFHLYSGNPSYPPSTLKFNNNITNQDGTTNTTVAQENHTNLKNVIALYASSPSLVTNLLGEPDSWDVTQLTSLKSLFNDVDFNEPIGNWDTRNITDMSYVFSRCRTFNQPIGKWDTSKVTNMWGLFDNAEAFNQEINTSVQERDDGTGTGNKEKYIAWDVSKVGYMQSMFNDTAFNKDISKWDTSSVVYMDSMFRGASDFNQTLGEKVIQLTDSNGNDFGDSYTAWNTSRVSYIQHMFHDATEFNNGGSTVVYTKDETGDVSYVYPGPELKFNMSGVINMDDMFHGAIKFNCPVYSWELNSVGPMDRVFKECYSFEQEVRSWTLPTHRDDILGLIFDNICSNTRPFGIKYIPYGAAEKPPLLFFTLYNGGNETLTMADGSTLTLNYRANVNKIDTYTLRFDNDITDDTDGTIAANNKAKLIELLDLYANSPSLVQSITNNNGELMFENINNWNVTQITDMQSLFSSNYTFNEDISNWDTRNVTNMSYMFRAARSFNQDISKWDTSKVTNMEQMFWGNWKFDCSGNSINTSVQERDDGTGTGNKEKYIAWDVSNVTNMKDMFSNTRVFNNDISNWDTSSVRSMEDMFRSAILYNQTLGEKYVQLKDSEGNNFGNPYTAWDTSKVTSMKQMFRQAVKFNNGSIDPSTGAASSNPGPELNFNTTGIFQIESMFRDADLFNSPVHRFKFYAPIITHFQYMFRGAHSFNQEVRTWNISSDVWEDGGFYGMFSSYVPAFSNSGGKWNNLGAQANPPVQFWDLFEFAYKSYSETIESTTIDGTVTTTYYYGGIHLVDDTVTPNKNYHIKFDRTTNADGERVNNNINLTTNIWETALDNLKNTDSSFDITKIGKIIIGNNITNLPDNMWNKQGWGNTLHYVEIGGSVRTIGNFAFKNCINLQSITIPNWVESIGHSCFEGCVNLTSLTLPELGAYNTNFTTLSNYLLSGTKVETLKIASSVTTIEPYFFANSSLKTIYIIHNVSQAGSLWQTYGFTAPPGYKESVVINFSNEQTPLFEAYPPNDSITIISY